MASDDRVEALRLRQEALKRDKEIIARLMKNRSLERDDDVMAIFTAIQSGNIHFSSEEGRRFDDEIFEKVQSIKTHRRGSSVSETKEKTKKKEAAASELKEIPIDDAVREELRKMEKRRTFARFGLLIGALLFLTVFAFVYYTDTKVDKEAEKLVKLKDSEPVNRDLPEFVFKLHVNETNEEITFEVLDKYKNIYNLNKSLIGWLKIDDTIIDYPVMQSVDNSYYLTHNFDQEEDKKGCLFLDYRNDITSFSDNMIIYGHHLRSGKMFGNLPDYQKEEYYEKHKYVQFDTIYEERTYQVMYVFRSPVYKENDINFKYYNFLDASSEAEFNSYMNEMKKLSLYDTGLTAKYGDELLTLSTCDDLSRDDRFVVVCKRIR